MPFMPFTLADLLSVPAFSPITDPNMTNDAQSILAFSVVAKSVIYQVLSGVAYLHSAERRIAHRDIKPRNILLDTSGKVALIDFGVAHSPTPGSQDVWPEPEGNMYFEVGSGYVQFPPSTPCCADVDPIIFLSDLIALQSFYLVCASMTPPLSTCGLSVPLSPSSLRPFTVTTLWLMTSTTTTRTPMNGAIPQRRIFLTICRGLGRALSGNAIRCSMARAATSALRGAFSVLVDRPRQRTGLSVFSSIRPVLDTYLVLD